MRRARGGRARRFAATCARLVARLSPDLVHANSLSTARLAGPVLAATGVPSVGHLRDIVGLSRQAIDDVNCLDRLVAVSEATREFHVAQGIDAAKCVVVQQRRRSRRISAAGSDGVFAPRVGASAECTADRHDRPGRDAEGDGRGARGGDAVGGGGAGRALARRRRADFEERTKPTSSKRCCTHAAQEPPLAGRVHFLGTRNDVSRLLPECALLVHAARQEPLGRVLLEAAACGLAVVATDVGGTREIFPSEAEGAVLVPADDAGAHWRTRSRRCSTIRRGCEALGDAGRAARRPHSTSGRLPHD